VADQFYPHDLGKARELFTKQSLFLGMLFISKQDFRD